MIKIKPGFDETTILEENQINEAFQMKDQT